MLPSVWHTSVSVALLNLTHGIPSNASETTNPRWIHCKHSPTGSKFWVCCFKAIGEMCSRTISLEFCWFCIAMGPFSFSTSHSAKLALSRTQLQQYIRLINQLSNHLPQKYSEESLIWKGLLQPLCHLIEIPRQSTHCGQLAQCRCNVRVVSISVQGTIHSQGLLQLLFGFLEIFGISK